MKYYLNVSNQLFIQETKKILEERGYEKCTPPCILLLSHPFPLPRSTFAFPSCQFYWHVRILFYVSHPMMQVVLALEISTVDSAAAVDVELLNHGVIERDDLDREWDRS
jgi:hypothetical protein